MSRNFLFAEFGDNQIVRKIAKKFFQKKLRKYLVSFGSGCNFASLLRLTRLSNCVSVFFDAFSERKAEIIEMFAMRKLTVQRQGRELPSPRQDSEDR